MDYFNTHLFSQGRLDQVASLGTRHCGVFPRKPNQAGNLTHILCDLKLGPSEFGIYYKHIFHTDRPWENAGGKNLFLRLYPDIDAVHAVRLNQ